MIPLEPSPAVHKLHAESNQRFRPAARPPVSSHSIHSMSYSGDYSAMGTYGFRKSSKGSVSAGVGSAGASSPEAPTRDSHDLQLNLGNGRESLVDNLLLSFDKIGDSLGAFDTSPYFSAVDEMDDDDDSTSNYSQRTGPPPTARGRRSNSTSNYHSHIGSFTGGPGGSANYSNRRVGSFDNGAEGFGASYDSGRETRSRGRGLGSSHGFANTYDPFDAAPPPSIRSGPRNRTPSPPRSPRLVRRPSNKSNKSLRRDQQQFNPQFEDPISLPPLPAFVNPSIMNLPSKTPQKQGFFRRVLGIGGGGGSGSGSGSSSNSVISKQQSNPAPRESSLPPHTSDSPHSTINKKPSFFRRRKKSVSDAISQPVLPLPLHTTEPISPIEHPTQSPSTSLSAAMNPYLRSPVKSSTFDFADDDHEHAYLQRGATIRTVASSDPISPKRPTFFGESLRGRDSGSHYNDDYSSACKVYRKDTRYARGTSNGDLGLQKSPPRDREDWDRPQTSPYTSTFAHKSDFGKDEDEREREMHWPPIQRSILSTRRSVGNVALERERQERERQGSTASSMYDKPRQGSVVSREMPIATVQELDAQHARAEKLRRESLRGKPLEVDTKLGANSMLGVRGPDNSWLSTPTPATAGTPTVMLQRDGPGEKAKLLEEDENGDSDDDIDIDIDNEEPSEETRELARKVFEGDEEVIPKTGVTSWLGDGYIFRDLALWTGLVLITFFLQKRCGDKGEEGLHGFVRLPGNKYIIDVANFLWAGGI